MNMAIDVVIAILIVSGGLLGFKQGVVKKFTSFVGTFAIIILAFMLKDKVSFFFYEYLPFFNFGGILKGVEVVNILLYEIVAFLVIFVVLKCLLRILLVITGLIEKILQATLFLSIPSRILGFIVGLFEYYVYIFIILVVIALPIFKLNIKENTRFASYILYNTPVLSNIASELIDTYSDTYNVINDNKDKSNETINELVLDMMLEKGLVTKESASNLIERGKVHVNSQNFLNKY